MTDLTHLPQGLLCHRSSLLIPLSVDLGNGIINADGDLWKRQRKAGLPFFSNANLKVFIDRLLPYHLKDTEKRLVHAAKNEDAIDMEAIFLELTTRLMGEMAYDVCVNLDKFFSKTQNGQLPPCTDPDEFGLDGDKRFPTVFQSI